jgi:hypothetical protein
MPVQSRQTSKTILMFTEFSFMAARKPILSAALVQVYPHIDAYWQRRNLKIPYCTRVWLSNCLVVLILTHRFSVSSLKQVTEVSLQMCLQSASF